MKKFSLFTFLVLTIMSTALSPVLAQDELIYVPVDPCRVVDTRNAGGAITANTNRNFRVSGSMGELAVQGSKTDCLDPKAGTGQKPLAISAYVVAVPASGSTSGVLTAYPSHLLPPPVGAGPTVNFAAGQVIGNTTNITLCDQVTCPTDGEFAILARNTNQHVVIDVQGYFYPSSAAKRAVAVDANNQVIAGVLGANGEALTILTSEGFNSSIYNKNGFIATRGDAFFTGSNCDGTSYSDYSLSLRGTTSDSGVPVSSDEGISPGSVFIVKNAFQNPNVNATEYWYMPKTPTFVDNVSIQSVKLYDWNTKTVLCDTLSATITTAAEVLPNDPIITGIPNSAFTAPIRPDYR